MKKPTVLMILDGYGLNEKEEQQAAEQHTQKGIENQVRLKTGGEIGGVYIIKQQKWKKTAEYQVVQLFFRFFRNHVKAFE